MSPIDKRKAAGAFAFQKAICKFFNLSFSNMRYPIDSITAAKEYKSTDSRSNAKTYVTVHK